MNEADDTTLVRRCLEGNKNAFGALVAKYQKPIYNAAYRMTKGYDDAADITQAVFIKAYEKLELYNPKFKFFSWLYRIAVNESLNFLKQRRQNEGIEGTMRSGDKLPDEILNDTELGEKIQNALMEIEMNYRLVIILKHFQNFSYKEMSRILDIPEKTVKSRLFTARQMLKDVLIKKGIAENE